MALDEVLLEVERLGLRARDDHLDVVDAPGERRGARSRVAALEVAAHARAQRLRLPDVQDFSGLVPKEVDAGPSWEPPELFFKVFSQSRAQRIDVRFGVLTRPFRAARPSSRRRSPHAGPGLVVGAVEDDVRATTLVDAQAKMTAFRLAGFRAVRIESYWTPGDTRPSDSELQVLKNVGDAGQMNGVRVFVTVMSPARARHR